MKTASSKSKKTSKKEKKLGNEFLNPQLLKVLFPKSSFGCALVCNSKFKLLNKKFTDMLGFKLKDIKDLKTFFNKIYPSEKAKEEALKNLELTNKSRKSTSTRTDEIIDKIGNRKTIKFNYHFLPENCLIMFIEDLTESTINSPELRMNSKMFEEIFNSSNDAIYLWKVVNKKKVELAEVNKAAEEMLGYSKSELLCKSPFDINPKSNKEILRSAFKNILEVGFVRFTTKHISKSGKHIDVEINSRLIEIENEKYILSITRDITERLIYQKNLVESENKYNRIINSMPFGVHIYEIKNNKLIFTGFNKAANEILRVDNSIYLNKTIEEAFPTLAETEIPMRYKLAAKSGKSWNKIFFNYQDDKLLGVFNINAFQISPGKMVATFYDISERVLSEKALRESEERYKIFINQISEGIWRVNFENPISTSLPIEEQIQKLMTESKIAECNDIFAKMYGYENSEEIIGKSLLELYGGKLNELNNQTNKDFILNNYRIENAETLEYTKDGKDKYFINNAFGVVKDGLLVNIWGTKLDITQNKNFEKSNAILAGIIESTSDFVITFNSSGNITYLNAPCEKYLGIASGNTSTIKIDIIFSPVTLEKIKNEAMMIASDYGLWQGEVNVIGSNKNEIPCSIVLISHTNTTEKTQLFSAIIRDISERKQIENSLLENQAKFRSIFENSFDTMLVLQYDKILDCNNAATVLFECSKEEIISKTPFDFSPEYQFNGVRSEVYGRELIKKTYDGQEQNFEWQHISKKGKNYYTEVSLKKFEFGNSNYLLGIMRDITSRKTALEMLQKSEELNRRLVESSPLGIIYVDRTGKIIYENPASLSIMGLDPTKKSPLIGKSLLDLPGLKSIEAYELLKKLMTGAVLQNEEIKFKSISGKEVYIKIFAAPMLNDKNKYIGAIIMFQDITETIKMSKALAETEGKLKLVIDNSPVIAYEIDPNGIISFWEGKGINNFNIKSSEVLGKSIFEVFKEYPEFIEDNKKALNGDSVSEVYNISNVFLDTHISPIISYRKNQILGAIGIAFDITERKKKDDILYNLSVGISTKTGAEFIEAVLKYLSKIFSLESIFIGEFIDSDKVATKYLVNLGEVGNNFVYRLKDAPCNNVFEKSAAIYNGNFQDEFPKDELLIKMGINSYFGITLFDSHHQPIGILVALKKSEFDNPEFLDSVMRIFAIRITAELERINYEKEMLKAIDAADKANKLKSEFLAQMSHEIRTPINTILSFTSLIEEDLSNSISSELLPSFNAINNAGRRIIRTIDLILNMSEIQTGSYEPYFTEFNLMDLLDNVYLEMKLLAKNKGIDLVLNSTNSNYIIYADNYTVGQIINNLVDNAVKYTLNGKVEIRVRRDEMNEIVVEIADTGIGISKEYLPYLFTAFSQEETGYTRKFEGNGLGLALVKSYCEINNATINVESEKNVGTKFTITFHSMKAN